MAEILHAYVYGTWLIIRVFPYDLTDHRQTNGQQSCQQLDCY